jgi:hypothetical protein
VRRPKGQTTFFAGRIVFAGLELQFSPLAPRNFCRFAAAAGIVEELVYSLPSSFGRHQSGAAMTKDAKLGLVLGIGLVIVISVVFFRKDATSSKAAETAAAAVKPKGPL